MKQIVTACFRVDASVNIGNGHVMRCLNLAEGLRTLGVKCLFICRNIPGNLISFIRDRDFEVEILDYSTEETSSKITDSLDFDGEKDSELTGKILEATRPHWLIIDHYHIDYKWQSVLKSLYKKLLVIDDLANRQHICDLLLDQNLGRKSEDYKSLVSQECQLLIGPYFALMNPIFADLRPYSLERRKDSTLKNILISMGGVDFDNVTAMVLNELKASSLDKNSKIKVVLGPHCPWIKGITDLSHSMPWETKILVNISNMAEIMANSDLCIGAGGITSWERCSLGLPSIIIEIAKNQSVACKALHKQGAAIFLGEKENIRRPA